MNFDTKSKSRFFFFFFFFWGGGGGGDIVGCGEGPVSGTIQGKERVGPRGGGQSNNSHNC